MTQQTPKRSHAAIPTSPSPRSSRWRRAMLGVLIAATSSGSMGPLIAGSPNFPFFTASRIHSVSETSAAQTSADSMIQPTTFASESEPNKASSPAPGSVLATAAPEGYGVFDESRPIVYLTLAEARARVLDSNPELDSFSNALAAIAENVTIADADFDGRVGVDIQGGKLDRQLSNSIQTFGLPTNELQTDFLRAVDGNMLSYTQRTRSGGEFLLGYNNDYTYLTPAGPDVLVNPAWDADLNFRFSQQLAQGRRRVINESPIQLARLAYTSLSADLRARINTNFRDVEIAYWNYAGLHAEAEAAQASTARFKKLVDGEKARLDLREATLVDVAQADELYQNARLTALDLKRTADVAAIELQRLMGDYRGRSIQLVPVDTPQVDPTLDFNEGMIQSGFRPELESQRTLIRSAKLRILQARDLLRPDIRANFGYAQTGLESDLDDAWDTIGNGNYQDWFVGFEFRQSVGQRAAYAKARQACRLLAAEQSRLEALRRDVVAEVNAAAINIDLRHEALEISSQRVIAATAQIDGRSELFAQKKADIDLLLRSNQTLIDAQRTAIQATYGYQQALAQWRFSTGTIDRAALGMNTTLESSIDSFEMTPSSTDQPGTPSTADEAATDEATAKKKQESAKKQESVIEAPPAPKSKAKSNESKAQPTPAPAPAPKAAEPAPAAPAPALDAPAVDDAAVDDAAAYPWKGFEPVVSTPYAPSWVEDSDLMGPIEAYPQVIVGNAPGAANAVELPVTPMQSTSTEIPPIAVSDQERSWSDVHSVPQPKSNSQAGVDDNASSFPEVKIADLREVHGNAKKRSPAPQGNVESLADELLPEVHVAPLQFPR